jgi:hypothetical protein
MIIIFFVVVTIIFSFIIENKNKEIYYIAEGKIEYIYQMESGYSMVSFRGNVVCLDWKPKSFKKGDYVYVYSKAGKYILSNNKIEVKE